MEWIIDGNCSIYGRLFPFFRTKIWYDRKVNEKTQQQTKNYPLFLNETEIRLPEAQKRRFLFVRITPAIGDQTIRTQRPQLWILVAVDYCCVIRYSLHFFFARINLNHCGMCARLYKSRGKTM